MFIVFNFRLLISKGVMDYTKLKYFYNQVVKLIIIKLIKQSFDVCVCAV